MIDHSTDISRIRSHAERSVVERAAEFLAAGLVAHVGIVQDGQPFVLPMNYQFNAGEPDKLYLHGGLSSRLMHHLGTGAPVCVTVTLVDGLVYSRSALYHSTNYRSVVCFGTARIIEDQVTKNVVLEQMIRRYFRGRTIGQDYFAATEAELSSTSLAEMKIEHISAKMREGGPKGPFDADPRAAGTCGVLDLPRIDAGVALPNSRTN